MVIVIVTRSDLRNESLMAEEAFALSPISARPAMPNEADYDAIREAFMETSRGRWFLSEYAKRNRNADTRMVLDAVARIEQNLAAQKQNGGPSIAESLVAIRAIVGEARAGVARAIVGLENEAVLAAAHDGARIIREVSWTLRECGADIRICNLLDTQVTAIDAGHRLVAEIDGAAVTAAFDGLLDRIHDLAGVARESRDDARRADRDEPASPIADGEMPEAAARPHAERVADVHAPAAMTEPAAAIAQEAPAEAGLTIVTAAETDEVEFVEAQDMQSGNAAEAAVSVDQPSFVQPSFEAAEEPAADVDAMLDLVAMEMSAPQPPEPGELEAAAAAAQAEAEQAAAASLIAGEPSEIESLAAAVAAPHDAADADSSIAATAPSIDVASFEIGERDDRLDTPQPMADASMADASMSASGMTHAVAPAMAMAATSEAAPAMAPPAMAMAAPAPASPSLGAALLASGLIGHPIQSRSDVLAPLRRMSQAEKVAFFS
ncbi:hypothetical protein SR870_11755 [Rhodopseudomonas palustris]|uniref:hypothetical protein n=1 Tax=Rhodopseudomonas palustris TaxID=1076 RepID=UPI002ACF05F3|nr:hypothetical protein [Rhodopseudomonas palustris]WQH01907.1 hypothetical protein SR870_11755 [Rhodopseudomonas palustris]